MSDPITTEVVDSTIEFEENLKSNKYDWVISIHELQYLQEDAVAQIVFRVYNIAIRDYDFITIPRTEWNVKVLRKMLIDRFYPCEDFKEIKKCVDFNLSAMLWQNCLSRGALVTLTHRTLGWAKHKGEIAFYADKIYIESGVVDSKYVGNKKIQPHGELSVYVGMLNECVLGNPAMEAICAMAAAATVLPFANLNWVCRFDNTINHLVETSSTGKTTAADLFVSLGAAAEDTDSWKLSYLGTNNSILKEVEQNCGFPVEIDELSSSKRKECTELMYSVANGVGRSRCTAGGTKVNKTAEFHTTFISTGESGLIKKCAKTDGINARIYEFEVDAWTRSGSESCQIKSVIRDNYGLITPLIAVELLKNGDAWEKVLNRWKEKVRQKMENEKRVSVIGDRIENVVALYMTGCEILNEILNVHLDVSEVYEFFYLHIVVAKTTDMGLGTRAYDAVIRHYKRYKDERYVDGEARLSGLSMRLERQDFNIESEKEGFLLCSRRVHKSKDGRLFRTYIVFLNGVLEEILERNGSPDARIAIKSMHREGLMKTKDKARDYMELSINGVKEKVYAVWVEDASYFDIPTEDDYDAEADEAEN